MTGFIMVYKLINGVFNSVHKFTVSTYTGINKTIILDQIIKSKDKDILLRLVDSELTDPLKDGFPATTALVRLPHSYSQLFPSSLLRFVVASSVYPLVVWSGLQH